MMKKQSHGARLPSIHGIWEGVSTVYCRACGAFLHSSLDRLFPAECNGNPHRAMERLASAVERFMSCSGKAHLVQWKVDLHKMAHRFMSHPQSPDIWITPYCNFMSKMRCTDWLMRSIVNFPCCIACLRAVTTLATCEGVYGPSTISSPARMDRTAAWLKFHLSLMPAM